MGQSNSTSQAQVNTEEIHNMDKKNEMKYELKYNKQIKRYEDLKVFLNEEFLKEDMLKWYYFYFISFDDRRECNKQDLNQLINNNMIQQGLKLLLKAQTDKIDCSNKVLDILAIEDSKDELLPEKKIAKNEVESLLDGLKDFLKYSVNQNENKETSLYSQIENYFIKLNSQVESIYLELELVPSNKILAFLENNFTNWFIVLKSLTINAFLKHYSFMPLLNVDFLTCELDLPSEILTEEDKLVISLSSLCINNKTKANLLYRGTKHGFSTNRFETHCLKYSSPTLTLLRGIFNENEIILAIYLLEPWKRSTIPFSKNAKVLELYPEFSVFYTKDKDNVILYHPSKGIQVGNPFLIKIEQDMQTLDYDITQNYSTRRQFNSIPEIPLSSNPLNNIELIEIEVYGLGGTSALEKQNQEWKFEQHEQENRTKIAAFENPNNPESRVVLEMAGLISNSEDIEQFRSDKPDL